MPPTKAQLDELRKLVLKFQAESAIIQHNGSTHFVDARDRTAFQIAELYEIVYGLPQDQISQPAP